MPDSIRTDVSCSEYIPSPSIVSTGSSTRQRGQCRAREDGEAIHERGDDSDNDEGGRRLPESPSERRQQRMQTRSAARRGRQGQNKREENASGSTRVENCSIQDQPYCTQKCLLGLARGGELDVSCPNYLLHRTRHPGRKQFLRSVRHQLMVDIGADARCVPMNLHGSRGGMLKVSLTTRGYTFVAKGVEIHDLQHLRNEREIYRRLRSVQGEHVPVCLGLLKLDHEYYCSGARLSHLLLMSWGGCPLYAPINKPFRRQFPELAETALQAIHRLNAWHNDAELMVIDFERSTSITPSGGSIGRYSAKRKTRYPSAEDELAAMLNGIRHHLQ